MATPLATRRSDPGFAIACVGLEWQTEASLRALLTVIRDRASAPWQHVDDLGAADLVFYDPTSPLAAALLRRAGREDDPRLFLPCGHQLPESAGGLRLPIGASRLLELLDQCGTRLRERGGSGHRPALSERLDALLQAPDLIGVAFAVGGETGYLSLRHRALHWPQPLDAAELSHLLFDEVLLRPIRPTDSAAARQMESTVMQMRSWDALLWAVAASTCSGRLLPRVEPQQRYQLSRWPDFGLIGRRSLDIKCTALLSQRALNPEELAAVSGLPMASVINFFNCAALCGILMAAPAPGPTVAAKPPEAVMGGLLKRLRQAFSLGTA